MASRYYGLVRGTQGEGDVIEGSSSDTSTGVEVRVDLALGAGKQEVLNQLDNIKKAIFADTWPPA